MLLVCKSRHYKAIHMYMSVDSRCRTLLHSQLAAQVRYVHFSLQLVASASTWPQLLCDCSLGLWLQLKRAPAYNRETLA